MMSPTEYVDSPQQTFHQLYCAELYFHLLNPYWDLALPVTVYTVTLQ